MFEAAPEKKSESVLDSIHSAWGSLIGADIKPQALAATPAPIPDKQVTQQVNDGIKATPKLYDFDTAFFSSIGKGTKAEDKTAA